MRKYLYFVFFLALSYKSFATHIVGGEIELLQLKNPTPGMTHEVILNLYFDAINGDAAAEDISLTLTFIQKSTLGRVGEATCQRVARDFIKYIDPTCSKGDLKTMLIKYRAVVNLTAAFFSDPAGYAIVWERCCRNVIITNIANPGDAGMVFYTEFPPVTTANSTPHFKDVVADYLCINQNFEMDFSASDADGDSLTYELITPWAGYSSRTVTNPVSIGRSSYPLTTWAEGISLSNVIPGESPLEIHPTRGILYVRPNKLGLYVFSVMVKEHRKGKMIGLAKRDFQLKVVDCPINLPPQVMVKNQNASIFFNENEVVNIKKGDRRCFDILYLDPDINQKITITTRGVNFDTQKIKLPAVSNVIVQTADTLRSTFCLDDCIVTSNNQPAEFIISVSDNGCPVPQIRHYRMKINFEDAVNNRPIVSTSLTDIPTVMFGDTLEFTVFGKDIDSDTLSLTGVSRGFALSNLGFTFAPQSGVGSVQSTLKFIPNCEAVLQKQILLDFIARDLRCGVSTQSAYTQPIAVRSEPNNAPRVLTSLTDNTIEVVLSPTEPTEISFEVDAYDSDNESIELIGVPDGFDFKNAIMTFDNKEGIGSVNSRFSWAPICSILNGQDSKEFVVNFLAQDKACEQKQDTVSVKFLLKNNVNATSPLAQYNTFTPNEDGINDYFNFGDIPENNCNRQFVRFEVFNRYGKPIFTTSDRNFKWGGDKEPAGEYLYILHFTDEVFKGIIHLIR